jgi:crotonobetainyl-CoA:carnitine CoA-transferase CaiB-like acyl-CoA transferase
VIDRHDLDADPRFATQAARQTNRDALTAALDAEFRRHPTRHWLDVLAGVLPVAPVYSLEEALESPFLRTNEMIRNVPHPARPDLRMLANPIRINGQRLAQRVCPPVGADNDAVLGRLAATAK